MVLGDHMEALRQRSISDETRLFLYENQVPRFIENRRQ